MSDPAPLPRSIKWRAYGLVRPLVRPVMGRVRMFFTGPLLDEIAALRREVGALRDVVEAQRRHAEMSADARVEVVMAQALATLALDRDRGQDAEKP